MMQIHVSIEGRSDNLILETNEKGSNSSFVLLEKKSSIYENIS